MNSINLNNCDKLNAIYRNNVLNARLSIIPIIVSILFALSLIFTNISEINFKEEIEYRKIENLIRIISFSIAMVSIGVWMIFNAINAIKTVVDANRLNITCNSIKTYSILSIFIPIIINIIIICAINSKFNRYLNVNQEINNNVFVDDEELNII